jgi:hypothetical protein
MATSNIVSGLGDSEEKKSKVTHEELRSKDCHVALDNEVGTRYALVKGEDIIVLYQPLPLSISCAIPRDRSRIFVFLQATGVRRTYNGPVRRPWPPYTLTLSCLSLGYNTSIHKGNRVQIESPNPDILLLICRLKCR